MTEITIRLPKDKNGLPVSDTFLQKKYHLPSNTQVTRNLAIRALYRAGETSHTILKREICGDIKTTQGIYHILHSKMYDAIEEKYHLL